jgi:hypothetical protein
MTDYEMGREARRNGEPLDANPYWWFRAIAWERGWLEQERVLTTRTQPQGNDVLSSFVDEEGDSA